MKSIKYTLTVSALFVLSFALDARGCGLPYFLPRYYYMYRVYTDPRSDDDYNGINYYKMSTEERNCKDWQRETPNINTVDIYNIVYIMSLDEYRDLYNARKYRGSNVFAHRIKTDRQDILDFLLLAKTNEHTRMRMNPRWYYPTMRTADTQTLEEIVQTALSRRDGSLGNRYLLQAMRALSSLQRYDECLALWENDLSRLPVYDPIRQLGEDCAARAMVATGRYAEATAYYAAKGDVGSLRFCAKDSANDFATTADIIEFVYDYCPDSPYLARALQQYIRQVEPKGYSFDRDSQVADITPEYKQLYRFALRVAAESRCPNPAMWYYTAAFIADLEDDPQRASQILSRAESARGTEFIKNSVRMMRIYLDAKMLPYNAAYERKLMGQLQWLDDQVRNNITPDIANITSILYNLQQNMSYYYWNDMLRRILPGEVCPRMIRLGRTTRALQLANMADNRLFNIVNNIDIHWCCGCGPDNYSSFTMDYYRTSGREMYNDMRFRGYFNSIDYSNDFFKLLDTLPTDRVVAYRDRALHPQDEFDRFLNTRGYVSSDYLCDIIGTKYLRAMRYAEAEQYLGMIKNPESNCMLNVTDYYLYSPFSIDKKDDRPKENFRHRFAREMHMLERQMNSADNPDTRAKAMVRYAVGIRNSFGRCWVLTQYYKYTEPEYYNMPDWEHAPECLKALRRSDSLIALACSTATDREFAASVQYAFNNYRTVVEQYPETGTACIVRHSCDRLIDYCPNLRSR